jgi:predicted enzyme related to lactoylglutathione lyase
MDMGDKTYTMIKVGEGTGGGLMKNPMPNADSMWVAYVNVDDLKAATAKAKSLGATVMKDQVEVKGGGSFRVPDRGSGNPTPLARLSPGCEEHRGSDSAKLLCRNDFV